MDDDCGDEILTPLSAGCLRCVTWNGDIPIHPTLILVPTHYGFKRWECPMCNGSYGIVDERTTQK